MAKIQVSTVKMTADVEVINVSSYLVAQVVRAHMRVDSLIEKNKYEKTAFNDETKEWEKVLDENGNPVYDYHDKSTKMIEQYVYPLLSELVEAFGVKDNRV